MRLKFFRIAKRLSAKSKHDTYKFGAVLVKGNKIISTGINQFKTHPKSNTFWKRIHAELDTILNAKQDVKGSSLYIYRQDRNGKQAISKPCLTCELMLKRYGIKKVYYTNEIEYCKEVY